jgi:ATP-dependent Clp protease adaptor protein ClpS
MAMQHQHGGLLEAEKTRLKPPPMYKVLLLNDDYTPMDFVVTVLQTVFVMSREKATQVMLQVHRDGVGVCGTFTREVAAAKVDQVTGNLSVDPAVGSAIRWGSGWQQQAGVKGRTL